MADLTATAGWPNIPQLETNTVALGGPEGPMNSQAAALLARTELLRSLIGSYDDFITHNANTTLTATDVGKLHTNGNNTSNITLTLPAANTVRKGSVITLMSGNKAITAQAAAGNVLSHPLLPNFTTFVVGATALNGVLNGAAVEQTFVSDGNLRWIPLGGIHALKAFFETGSNNIIKLPDGKIIQYGNSVSTDDALAVYTFHVPFPNEVYHVNISLYSKFPIIKTLSTFAFNRNNDIDGSVAFDWLAIGR